MENKETYYLLGYIDSRFGDPISSIKITNKFIIIGTMTGKIKIYSLRDKNILILVNENSEEISGLSYDELNNNLYALIGDEYILKYKLDNTINGKNEINFTEEQIKLYYSEFDHNINCDNSYTFLSNYVYFKIVINQFHEGDEKILIDVDTDYEIKYLVNLENKSIDIIKGKLKMTNYVIPLDFDGEKFVWIEFIEKEKRNFCIANIPLGNSQQYKYSLDSFGRINHSKLLNDGKVLIVHSLNKCEIRKIEDFKLLEKFSHKGDEVYAIDIYYHGDNRNNFIFDEFEKREEIEEAKQTTIFNRDTFFQSKKVITHENKFSSKKKLNPIEMGYKKKIEPIEIGLRTDSLFVNKIKTKEEENSICSIITLDIDGNINLYENGNEITLFNLFNIKGIPKEHKDKLFFSMGYAYYIKSNLRYFCISSDFGCYIIKYNSNNFK